MDASLISDLDIDPKIGKNLGGALDNRILGLPAQVRWLMIEHIVVQDVFVGWLPRQAIPYRLEEATRHEMAVCQTEIRKSLQDRLIHGVLCHQFQEPISI